LLFIALPNLTRMLSTVSNLSCLTPRLLPQYLSNRLLADMTSFKQAAEAEFEGPSTLIVSRPFSLWRGLEVPVMLIAIEEHLPPHISSQSCDDLGQRPIGLAFRCSKAFITFAVCMAVFTVRNLLYIKKYLSC
jgi:hypothetical protein